MQREDARVPRRRFLLFPHRFLALAGIYLAGVLLALASALLSKGKEEEAFVMETARLRLPPLSAVCRALLFSLKQFIIKIVTVVAAFLVVLWFLLSFSFSFRYVGQGAENSMLAVLCRGLKYLFYPMGITQWQVALAALSGIVAKENVAGTLALFYGEDLSAAMSAPSACAFLVFLLTCSPCVSAVAASAKAVGVRRRCCTRRGRRVPPSCSAMPFTPFSAAGGAGGGIFRGAAARRRGISHRPVNQA